MNFTVPPAIEDIEVISASVFEDLPEEILKFCEEIQIVVEDIVDEATEIDQGLDDPFELLALYKNGREIAPGIEKKIADSIDTLTLYRRPILDLWCETGEDFSYLLRQIMIEELGRKFDFTESEIAEMTQRHYQGML